MDGVCPSCGVLRFMSFQWMERILQDEIEFCCRLCPRTKGLWHSSTCEGLSSDTPKLCMTEVHHCMVEEEERMKIENGHFFQKPKFQECGECSECRRCFRRFREGWLDKAMGTWAARHKEVLGRRRLQGVRVMLDQAKCGKRL